MRNPTTVSHAAVTVIPQPTTIRPVVIIMNTVNANGKFTRWEPLSSMPSQRDEVVRWSTGAFVALWFGWTSVGADANGALGSAGIGPSHAGRARLRDSLESR
jgi:hypothetical protein